MVDVLYFSDRDVKRKLFERVDGARRPLIVVQIRTDRYARPPQQREPFVSIEREFGDLVDLIVVADEGSTEGMWRDPVGDLADRFFPNDREASFAAATGYMLIVGGEVRATIKKRGVSAEDFWLIQEALSGHIPGIPPPDPALRPGKRKRSAGPTWSSHDERAQAHPDADEDTQPRARIPPQRAQAGADDPWKRLGIAPGTPLSEAKKAFRAMIAQYHPDKVAHLAPEFRELAERRTREILDAWRQLEALAEEEGG
ncbi:MAG: J domain-containing protein [Myxococcaceae bacterium]|nr:J domain-containing protein [Myxococcaceae bacterium]